MSLIRTRWAALGAAVAVTLGAGGIGLVSATSPTEALTFIPITPCRVIDTRPAFNVGPRTAPLGAGDVHTVSVHGDNGNCTGIPADAVAVSMNVTSTDATAPTFLTIWAAGAARPDASSLNPVPGAPATPNAVTTEVSSSGAFNIYNLAGSVHVLADINGYYVDHHHDDRYYTKAEIDAGRPVIQSYSPHGMVFAGATGTSTYNGCPTRPTGGATGWLGLDLPVGARLGTITASVFDDGSTNVYAVTVSKQMLSPTQLSSEQVGHGTGGSSTTFGIASVDLSPATETSVGPGESLLLSFSTPPGTNGFCGVTVEYTLPAP